MNYLAKHHTPTLTKAQLRGAHTLGRANKARKFSRLVFFAIVLVTSGAVFFDAQLGQGARAKVSGMISGLEIAKDDSNSTGKFVQSTLAMLDY